MTNPIGGVFKSPDCMLAAHASATITTVVHSRGGRSIRGIAPIFHQTWSMEFSAGFSFTRPKPASAILTQNPFDLRKKAPLMDSLLKSSYSHGAM